MKFNRKAATRQLGRKTLIYCEGTKSEHGYFEDIRRSLSLTAVEIVVRSDSGRDPESIVRAAKAEVEQRKNQKRWDKEDTAWAVYDGDEHIQNDPANWARAIDIANRGKINLAISNPCFEYWYLLHYQEQNAAIHRDTIRKSLKLYIPKYSKADILYQNELRDKTELAICRADERCRIVREDRQDEFANPSTHVGRLVQVLLSYQEDI